MNQYRGHQVMRAAEIGLPLLFQVLGITVATAQTGNVDEQVQFPVTAAVLIDGKFSRCEGITFTGEGELYVAGDRALWHVSTEGDVAKVAELYSNLGLAAIGSRDILMADFGPTNRFDYGPNADGIVWRITPEGEKTRVIDGRIGDANFVLMLDNGMFLVSDDATDEILVADTAGHAGLFTDAIGHPNGMVLSLDGSVLYVAQTFTSLRPLAIDDRVWAVRLDGGRPVGTPEVVARLGAGAGNDGLAMDEQGRLYVAANGAGKIWRVDPGSGETMLVAENLPGVASLAFGQGAFDHHTIYATSTRTGRVWAVRVGVGGAPLPH